jgi:hypothetical protein
VRERARIKKRDNAASPTRPLPINEEDEDDEHSVATSLHNIDLEPSNESNTGGSVSNIDYDLHYPSSSEHDVDFRIQNNPTDSSLASDVDPHDKSPIYSSPSRMHMIISICVPTPRHYAVFVSLLVSIPPYHHIDPRHSVIL